MKKQQFRIDLTNGIDKKSSEYTVVPTKLTQADNVVFSDKDAVSVRAGLWDDTTALGMTPTRLWEHNGDLVVEGISSDTTTDDFLVKMRESATGTYLDLPAATSLATAADSPAVLSCLPELFPSKLASENNILTGSTATHANMAIDPLTGFIAATRLVTGASGLQGIAVSVQTNDGHALASFFVATGGTANALRVVNAPNYFFIYYNTSGDDGVSVVQVLKSDWSYTTAEVLPPSGDSLPFDAIQPLLDSSQSIVLAVREVPVDIIFYTLSSTDGLTITNTITHSASISPAGLALAVGEDSGGTRRVYCSYYEDTQTTVYGMISGLKGNGTTLSTDAGVGETALVDFGATISPVASEVKYSTIADYGSGRLTVLATAIIEGNYSIVGATFTAGATLPAATPYVVAHGCILASHALSVTWGGNPSLVVYALTGGRSSDELTGLVALLIKPENGSTGAVRDCANLLGSFFPGNASPPYTFVTTGDASTLFRGEVYNHQVFALGGHYTEDLISRPGSGSTTLLTGGVLVYDVIRLQAARYDGALNAIDAAGYTALPGSVTRLFTGVNTLESGFVAAPAVLSSANGGSGSVMGAGVYLFKVAYSHVDIYGNRLYSSPSPAFSVTAPGGSSFYVTIAVDSLFNRLGTIVHVYRTKAGESSYYLDQELAVSQNACTVRYDSRASDTILNACEPLYTEGGVIPNVCMPATRQGCLWQGRIVATDGREIFFTHKKDLAFGYEYTDANRITPPGDWGRIVGVMGMDDKLVIFGENRIGYIYGSGPNKLAEGGFSDFITLPVATGARWGSHCGIILCDEGIWFHATSGLRLISRNLQLGKYQNGLEIGSEVDEYTPRIDRRPFSSETKNLVIAATNSYGLPETRFFFDDGTCLVLNREKMQFSRFTNHDAASAVTATMPYHISSDYSKLYYYYEGSGTQKQSIGDGTTMAEYPIILKTGRISLGGIQGYSRLSGIGVHLETPDNFTVSAPLRVSITVVTDDTNSQTETFDLLTQGTPAHIFEMQTKYQKCTSAQITVSIDPNASGTTTTGQYFGRIRVTNLTLTLGLKEGTSKQLGERK